MHVEDNLKNNDFMPKVSSYLPHTHTFIPFGIKVKNFLKKKESFFRCYHLIICANTNTEKGWGKLRL